MIYYLSTCSELIAFGWGQFDYHEEAKMLDQKHLRKISKNQFVA